MHHETVTAAEMKALEHAANENGLLYIQMMENAGRAAFAQLRRLPGPVRLLVVAGKGNNGGDGFVMARVAAKLGWPVQLLLAEGEPKTPDAITNFALLHDLPVEILPDAAAAAQADAVVDALYGTGFRGALRPAARGLRAYEPAASKRCVCIGGRPAQRHQRRHRRSGRGRRAGRPDRDLSPRQTAAFCTGVCRALRRSGRGGYRH